MNTNRALFVLLGLLLTATLGAQNVAEDILKDKAIQGIEFKNYVGPHRVIETRAAIQGIGADLGRQMHQSGAVTADYAGKYRVVRVHETSPDKLSADILILEPGAGVDHIRNLNWIVSSYLQQAFGYSVADADLLASFVTRYNAYFRGKMSYVSSAYVPSVAAAVTPETVGLALSYADWPGKTRMLIPLRDSLSKGLTGSVNAEEISNKGVTTQMAQEPGQGLEERKKLADLKEGEIVQEQKAVAQAEAKITESPAPSGLAPTAKEPEPRPTSSGSPASTPSASPGASSAPTPTPAPLTAVKTPSPTPAAVPIEQAKKDLAARDQALQAERQDIVKQETKKPSASPTPAPAIKPASTVAFVKMNEATKAGQVWLIDPVANRVWKRSELNSVRQTTILPLGAGLLVVAGDSKSANGAVRLVLVSKDDASTIATGSDDVSPDTPLLLSGGQVYALVKADKGGWVIGLFDSSLKTLAKGTDALSSVTAFTSTTGGILVQGSNGVLMLVDPITLKKKSNTEG